MQKFSSFNEAYVQIAKDLMEEGHLSHGTKEINNYTFTLTNLDDNILSIVPVSYVYMCGEMLWYAMGDESLSFINRFHSTGMPRTSETEFSNSAYGHILQYRHGFNQIQQVIDLLKKSPDSRRAIINLNVPDRHRTSRKDEICTIALQYYVVDGKLNCTGMMRSNDAYGCLPYDLAFFTELQKYIANKVGIPYGEYTHFAVSFHTYERNWNILKNINTSIKPKTVKVDFEAIMNSKIELYNTICSQNLLGDSLILEDLFKKTKCLYC